MGKIDRRKLFISYCRQDEPHIKALYANLMKVGLNPWMDTKDLLPGQDWRYTTKKNIREADFFVACLSKNSVNSRGEIQKEIKEALEIWKGKLEDDIFLIPVRLEECEIPEILSSFHWVNLFETNGFEKLLKSFEKGSKKLGIDSLSKRKMNQNDLYEVKKSVQIPIDTQKSHRRISIKLSLIISAFVVLFVGVGYIFNDLYYRKSDFTIINCPDGNIVTIPNTNLFPTSVTEYTTKMNSQLAAISFDLQTDIVALTEKLNQENIMLQNQLKATYLGLQTAPCDARTRERYWDTLDKINNRNNVLKSFVNDFSEYAKDESKLQQILDFFESEINVNL